MTEHIPPCNGKDFEAYLVQFCYFNECIWSCAGIQDTQWGWKRLQGRIIQDPRNPRKIKEPRQRRRDSGWRRQRRARTPKATLSRIRGGDEWLPHKIGVNYIRFMGEGLRVSFEGIVKKELEMVVKTISRNGNSGRSRSRPLMLARMNMPLIWIPNRITCQMATIPNITPYGNLNSR